MNISFKAHYLDQSTIKQVDPVTKEISDFQVQLAELEPVSNSDYRTLQRTAKLWEPNEDAFVHDIKDDFNDFFEYLDEEPNKRFLALTLQKDNFENLKAKDILAVIEFYQINKYNYEIKYLEVNPRYTFTNKDRSLKKIGTAMLDYLKDLLKNKDIVLDPVLSAIPFYEANEFKMINGCTMKYTGHIPKAL